MSQYSIDDLKHFLKQCLDIQKKFQETDKETGQAYNIFKITGIYYKEVIMCRVIANLLNPKGSHHKGDIYLKLFIDTLPEDPCFNDYRKLDTEKAHVGKEYHTDRGSEGV
jgi:hypothetical protein